MFFTEKNLHEFYLDLPEEMTFFTRQFIHSLFPVDHCQESAQVCCCCRSPGTNEGRV